jgi:hypothetical protein
VCSLLSSPLRRTYIPRFFLPVFQDAARMCCPPFGVCRFSIYCCTSDAHRNGRSCERASPVRPCCDFQDGACEPTPLRVQLFSYAMYGCPSRVSSHELNFSRLQKKKLDWCLRDDDIARAAALMKSDGFSLDQLHHGQLAFLYAKQLAKSNSAGRIAVLHELLHPDEANVPAAGKEELRAAHDRLQRIASQGEHGLPLKASCTTFDTFARKYPAWSNPTTSFVLFSFGTIRVSEVRTPSWSGCSRAGCATCMPQL